MTNKKTLAARRVIYNRKYYEANKERIGGTGRVRHLKDKYGLSTEDVAAMLASQHSACAICGTKDPRGKHKVFHVDHCHTTRAVRGLLCHNCNVGLGNFQDDPALLMRATEYIIASRTLH
jgi:Recombination endonuclease VII